MRTYQCWSCNVTLSEVDKLWDATVNVGRCPRCYEALREAVSLQEKIYNNISLISQGSRSLWVLAVLLFLTMYATAPLIFGNAYWTDWMKLSATQVILDVAMPAAYILFCYSIGVLSCKTSKRLGIFLLMFSLFLLIGFGFFILFFISELIVGRVPSQINFEFSSQNFHNFTGRITGQIDLLEVLKQDAKTATLFLVGVSLDAVIALYVGVVLTKAAYWFVFADPFSRTMVSDIYKTPMFSKASFSRTLGLPFSITHVKVRRSKVLFYLVVSSISFSASAAALASLPMAVTTAMSLGNLSIFITPAVSAREAAEALHQMGIHTFLLPPLLLPTAAVFLFIGVSAQRVGRRHATSSIEEVQELDVRRPILFLRAFRDDQLCLANPKLPLMSMSRVVGLVRGKVSLDVMLLEEGIDYGPVVALGNPQDSLPPYGAARGYFDDRTWHDGVAALAQTSSVIVICLDDTEGILWELDYILKNNLAHKTLFLMRPNQTRSLVTMASLERIADGLNSTAKDREELLKPAEQTPTKMVAVIGFFLSDNLSLELGRSDTFSRTAYLMMIRWFLRTRLAGESQETPPKSCL